MALSYDFLELCGLGDVPEPAKAQLAESLSDELSLTCGEVIVSLLTPEEQAQYMQIRQSDGDAAVEFLRRSLPLFDDILYGQYELFVVEVQGRAELLRAELGA